jgi:hypothetical protein
MFHYNFCLSPPPKKVGKPTLFLQNVFIFILLQLFKSKDDCSETFYMCSADVDDLKDVFISKTICLLLLLLDFF